MDYCSDHKECNKKLFDACQGVGLATSRIDRIAKDIEILNYTIFGEGEGNSLKSRIKGSEDALLGLKELVLENREVVQTNMKGLFKIFVMTISAASVIICIVFGVMWAELRSVNDTIATLQHHQLREPSPSPPLPFKHDERVIP
jgi:hypothetical protein